MLQQVVVIVLHLAVHLVGGDVDELFDADLFRTFQEHVSAIHVVVGEAIRVAETQIYMRLSCKVKDCINLVTLQAINDLDRVGDIALIKAKVSLLVQGASVVGRGAIIKFVKRDNVVSLGVGDG